MSTKAVKTITSPGTHLRNWASAKAFKKANKKRKKHNIGGRANLFEELGRVEGESSNRNRRAEVSRIHGELNRGYKKGGRSGYGSGGAVLKNKKVGIQIK